MIFSKSKIIYLGADHAGYKLKEELKRFLKQQRMPFEDLGAHRPQKNDDYPDYAAKVSEMVVKNKAKGILICGTGTGMVIAANKKKGIRAALAYDKFTARTAREHNDANILCLNGWKYNAKKTKQIVKTWLNTKFSGASRHKRRLNKIRKLENG